MFDFETATIGIIILTPIYAVGFKMALDLHDIKGKFLQCKYCVRAIGESKE